MESDDLLLQPNLIWNSDGMLRTLDTGFQRALKSDSPQVLQPEEILVPLKPHQRAMIHAMVEHEKSSMTGISYKNSSTYTNYGILGDEVGSGKSLVVLGFIAYKKHHKVSMKRNALYPYSKSNFFTVYSNDCTNINNSPSLIIVPHTIYRQWQDYCKKQTTLNVFYAKSNKELTPTLDISGNLIETDILKNKLTSSDIVLVSNTLYGDVQKLATKYNIMWNRVFVDEADSIYITGGNPQPNTAFSWFITATWSNFLMNGQCVRPLLLDYYSTHQQKYTPELGTWLRSELGISEYAGLSHGRITWMRTRSTNWLRDFFSQHILRGISLLFTSSDFLKESQKMPGQVEKTFLCEQPASHRAVLGLVNQNIQQMLHAGNVEGALAELGVSSDTPVNLVEAVTEEREKELNRLKKTLAFKETMDYATPIAKETALATLRTRIASIEEQLRVFRERLITTTAEECPICYEDPKKFSGTLTPCCHRIFCGGCILNSLTRRLACPMCRTPVQPNQLIRLVEEKKKKVKKEEIKLLSKQKQLLKFLQDNPTARVLVFSRYDNPFINLENDCQQAGITYHTLRGNKDVIANTIKSFESGEKRVLFLPTQSAGAGLNLVSATHVVLLHAMTPEEEKQVIGRAYRLGRTEPLQIIRLLHEGETIMN